MNDLFIRFSVLLLILNIPAKFFKKWIDEFAPQLSFFVATRL